MALIIQLAIAGVSLRALDDEETSGAGEFTGRGSGDGDGDGDGGGGSSGGGGGGGGGYGHGHLHGTVDADDFGCPIAWR